MKITNDGKKILEPGDRLHCKGITCTVASIAYQEYWEDSGFIAEFTDTTGRYRSWKQYLDGGDVMPEERKYYSVTFQYSESVYCSNIAVAKRKRKPIVEIPEREESEKCIGW